MPVREEIDLALAAHRVWRTRLKQMIEAGEVTDNIDQLRSDKNCTFGKWLHSLDADEKATAHFATVLSCHAAFHETTAKVAEAVHAGRQAEASAMLDLHGEYSLASEKLVEAMLAWRETLEDGSRLSVVSAFFTIYAFEALKDSLNRIERMEFLFGEPKFIRSLDPEKDEKKSFIIDASGLALTNTLQQKGVARDCAQWIRERVEIRSIRKSNLLHGKMYHLEHGGVAQAILGSSNFTVRGLGLPRDTSAPGPSSRPQNGRRASC